LGVAKEGLYQQSVQEAYCLGFYPQPKLLVVLGIPHAGKVPKVEKTRSTFSVPQFGQVILSSDSLLSLRRQNSSNFSPHSMHSYS
jgi:hypothetical protein